LGLYFVFLAPADGEELAPEQGCCCFSRLRILSIVVEMKVKTLQSKTGDVGDKG